MLLPLTQKTSKKSEKAKAGVMTAGIWNDLENWDRFNKTLQDEKIHANQWNWKMDNRRYAVEITDKNGNPAIDIALQLRNEDGSIFWTARTDNRGFAELWYAPYLTELKDLPHDFLLHAQYGERPFTKLGKVGSDGDVRNSFRINFEKFEEEIATTGITEAEINASLTNGEIVDGSLVSLGSGVFEFDATFTSYQQMILDLHKSTRLNGHFAYRRPTPPEAYRILVHPTRLD